MRIALAPRITAGFGDIDSSHPTPHTGIDYAMPIGSSVYAPEGGIISRITDYGATGLGKAVMMKTQAGYQYIFGHLSDNSLVRVGERVHKGDILALSGNTGNSTGPHLHLGVIDKAGHFIDPDKVPHEHSNLGILGMVVKKGIENTREKAEHHIYDYALGILDAFRDLLVDLSYSIALIGSGLCIILHVAGWEKGRNWAGILTAAYVLIKYLLG